MAKAHAPRLKVFQAQFGFFDSVVAAPSQAAALDAWGIHQNLFASKDARIITDAAAVAAALEHPGIPLQRAVGTKDPFRLEPSNPPRNPSLAKGGSTHSANAKPAKPAKPKADRSQLDRTEAALLALNERRQHEDAELQQAQEQLRARRTEARQTYEASRKAAAVAISKARAAYRAAGGKD